MFILKGQSLKAKQQWIPATLTIRAFKSCILLTAGGAGHSEPPAAHIAETVNLYHLQIVGPKAVVQLLARCSMLTQQSMMHHLISL